MQSSPSAILASTPDEPYSYTDSWCTFRFTATTARAGRFATRSFRTFQIIVLTSKRSMNNQSNPASYVHIFNNHPKITVVTPYSATCRTTTTFRFRTTRDGIGGQGTDGTQAHTVMISSSICMSCGTLHNVQVHSSMNYHVLQSSK